MKLRGFALFGLLAVAVVPAGGAVIATETGCGWLSQNGPAVENDVAKDGQCVLSQIISGNSDAGSIASLCGGLTVEQVEQIAISLFDTYVLGEDAGLGARKPPFKGAPVELDADSKAKVAAFRNTFVGKSR